jgi:phosphoenolpyruvate carboxykinase (ATP)
MYHFISGYTAKVAGTEMGVTDPSATFSACFGAAFLVWHPAKYAELLSQKISRHDTKVWLINTGWVGGGHGVGKRMSLKDTRAIIDAIHDGSMANVEVHEDPVFGLAIPKTCPGVPSQILNPRDAWADASLYDNSAQRLADLFRQNFTKFADGASAETIAAGPK